jgi:hypothetical protein
MTLMMTIRFDNIQCRLTNIGLYEPNAKIRLQPSKCAKPELHPKSLLHPKTLKTLDTRIFSHIPRFIPLRSYSPLRQTNNHCTEITETHLYQSHPHHTIYLVRGIQ